MDPPAFPSRLPSFFLEPFLLVLFSKKDHLLLGAASARGVSLQCSLEAALLTSNVRNHCGLCVGGMHRRRTLARGWVLRA